MTPRPSCTTPSCGFCGRGCGPWRIGAVALAALALVFWSRPTGKVVIGLTLVLLVVLAAIEFLARPGQVVAHARQLGLLPGSSGHGRGHFT